MITIKEEFVGCTKWLRAVELGGSDAIVMWLVLKGYAASNPTDGFIPDEDIERLPGKPRSWRKALKALVDCGRMQPDGSRSAGLLDAVQHGWQLHDYLDHAPSSAEVEERRRKERERKRVQRGTNGGTRPGTGNGTPPGTTDGTEPGTDDGTPDGTAHGVPEPPRARPRVPTLPVSTQLDPPPESAVAVAGPIPCPADLDFDPAQRANLAINVGIPAWFLDAVLEETRAKYADGSDPRTLERWRRTVVTIATSRWSDPRNRRPPEHATPSGQPPARPVERTPSPTNTEPTHEPPSAWERLEAERKAAAATPVKTKTEQLAELRALEEAAAGG